MKNLSLPLCCLLAAATPALAQPTGPTIKLQPDAVLRLPTGAGLAAVVDADFNHDLRRDLAVTERNLNQVAVYIRQADGTYTTTPQFTYPAGTRPTGMVTINHQPGSYHASLLAASGPDGRSTFLRDDGDPSGKLTPDTSKPYYLGTNFFPERLEMQTADRDGDGFAEIMYTWRGFNLQTTYIACESHFYYGKFVDYAVGTRYTYQDAQLIPTSFTLADFNRDGKLDLVAADSTNSRVHISADFIRISTLLETTGRGPVSVTAQDLNTDQLPDLAVAYAGTKEVMVLLADPANMFSASYSYKLPAVPTRVLFHDLNLDGRPDMLVLTADNVLRVYQHDGRDTPLCFTSIAPTVLATGVDPRLLSVADIDQDGYKDVVVGCPGDNTVRVYLNRTFSQPTATHASQALAGAAVYPTRATDQVMVRLPTGLSGPCTATLHDELGRVVRQQALPQPTTTLAVGELPRGLYVLRLSGPDGSSRAVRLSLQ